MPSQNDEMPRDDNAQFALKPLAPEGGWPLNYAYLIKTSAPLADIYPIMGELLFSSYRKITTDNNGKNIKEPPNAIYVAIDDDYELLLWNLLSYLEEEKEKEKEKEQNKEKEYNLRCLIRKICLISETGSYYEKYIKKLFLADTFGEFGKDGTALYEQNLGFNTFFSKGKIAGSGNPMKIYKFIDVATRSISDKMGKQEEKQTHSSWNVYLINSLTAMYRNLGLGETVALMRMVLKKMWETSSKENDGILFAIIQDGVMREEEQRYIESFFDGIIRVENKNIPLNGDKENKEGNIAMVPSIIIEKSFGIRRVFPESLFLPLSMTAPDLAGGKPAESDWKEAVFTKYAPAPKSVEDKK